MTNNEFKYKQLEQAGRELAEQQRHSLALEALEGGKLQETIRHQQMQESIDRTKADEAYRHNREMEMLQATANDISKYQADTQRTNVLSSVRKAEAETLLTSTKNKLEPLRYVNEKAKSTADVRKSYSDVNTNERNAATKEYEAETHRLSMMKDTVLGAGDFVLNAVGTATGSLGKILSLL